MSEIIEPVEDWVARATTGDPQAVEALLERYVPWMQRYVRHHVGALVAAKESSSDLVQSVCREAIERLRDGRFQYRGEAQFRQWLQRAAVMKMMNRHRHYLAQRRDARRELRAGGDDPSSPGVEALPDPGRFRGPHSEAAWSEELEQFEHAFASLPDRYREIISLSYVDGLSHAEIAGELGVTEANSRMLLSRALARLARLGVQA